MKKIIFFFILGTWMVRAMSCDFARINSLQAKYFISTKPYDLYRGTVRIIDVTIKQFL